MPLFASFSKYNFQNQRNYNLPPLSALSDHRPLTITIASNSMAHGPGFWHLDNNVLKDLLYVNECNNMEFLW